MKILRGLPGILFGLAVILAILYVSVMLPAYSMEFYKYEYNKNSTYEAVGMTEADLETVTGHLIEYLKGREHELNIMTSVSGESRLFFSDREIYHMDDVLELFEMGRVIALVSAVLIAAGILVCWLWKAGRRAVYVYARGVIIAVIAAGAAVAIVVSFNFNYFFTMFHNIFFSNDLWILDSRVDLLINIVPLPFFIDIAVVIAGLFIVMSGILVAALSILIRRTPK